MVAAKGMLWKGQWVLCEQRVKLSGLVCGNRQQRPQAAEESRKQPFRGLVELECTEPGLIVREKGRFWCLLWVRSEEGSRAKRQGSGRKP